MGDQDIAKNIFAKQFAQVQKKRQEAMSRPLTPQEVGTLLAMRFNGEPQFESVDLFYSEEFKRALNSGQGPSELSKLQRYRPATQEEANLLYCDIHARDEKTQYATFHTESN